FKSIIFNILAQSVVRHRHCLPRGRAQFLDPNLETTMRPSILRTTLYAAGLSAMSVGCGDGGSSPSTEPQVSLSLATRPAGVPSLSGSALAVVAAPETYTDGAGNTLTFDRVQLVLREIEMESQAVENACEVQTGDDDCAEIEIGPMLVDLPLGSAGAARALTAIVPSGTYDEVEFEIHKPESSDDAAFLAANPGFAGVSIRAEGSYNGTPFVYLSDLDVEMEFDLAPPLVIGESSAADLTLFVDLGTWFRAGDGSLVDPVSGNDGGANEGLVNENVKSSLEAFEDDDHDGSDDHSGSGSLVAADVR
ncbi:MAG TPA: hypothetical protein VFZ26_08255, partial [Gemmatimonadales bacterium]